MTQSTPHHAFIGQRIEDLDTPALLLDAKILDANLRLMAEFFRGKKTQLRPHFKNHKCITLARRQVATGSTVGMTCAKLGEAEVLADHGFNDILVANQVVGAAKVARLIALARRVKIAVAIDDPQQALAISEAAAAASGGGVTVGILIEVDVGMGRCGVKPGAPALELAQQIVMLPGLRLEGIQAFEGHVIYINDRPQREHVTRLAMQHAVDTRQFLEDHGIKVRIISGGSTSTYNVTGTMVDEIQAGSYPTMDWRYNEATPEFGIAMSVLTRIISKRPGAAVLDVGVKGAGQEFGLPKIKGHPQIEVPFFLAEEHLVVKNAPAWRVGDAVELISSHACTTCNLHRQFFVHEDGRVVDVWPIEASGMLA